MPMSDAIIAGTDSTRSGVEPCHGIPWICVWTAPNQETRAQKYLKSEEISVFAPLYETRLPNRSLRVEPMFRRYIFAQAWRIPGELKPNGIVSILRHSTGAPKIVPQWVIDGIVAQSDDDGIIRPPKPNAMKKGQDARIVDGPFANFRGIFLAEADNRVKMLMTLFGRASEVWFRQDQVEAA